jgi:DhnA family fructose-bisphosphate aldolase class Ia
LKLAAGHANFQNAGAGGTRGGGNSSINGRNTFQRPKKEGLDMLGRISKICRGSTEH